MPEIKKICTITGKEFSISEQEQELRKKFGVELPDIHPYERLRYLFTFRNYHTLYARKCDMCQKNFLSVHDPASPFQVYCATCWYSDKWTPPELELDLDKPFFEQFQELVNSSPHSARSVQAPMINSEYSNAAQGLKDCYYCFNMVRSEKCLYSYGSNDGNENVDDMMGNDSELLYDTLQCNKCFKVFWSEFCENCNDSLFLYDCTDSHDCAFSTGLRHKSFVLFNEQLSESE